MIKKALFISLLISFFFTINTVGQTSKINGITSQYIALDSINLQGDSLFDLVVSVHLVDTLNISKVNIKIGNAYGGDNVVNGQFNWFNNSLNTPSNIMYDRKFGIITFRISGVIPRTLFYQANTLNFQSVSDTPYIRQN